MAVNRNAGKTESRNRYILYLHKSKHADLCSFLDSLPNGSVSNFLQEAVRTYLLAEGHSGATKQLAPESAPPTRRTRRKTPEQPLTAPVTVTTNHPKSVQTSTAYPTFEATPYSAAPAITTPAQPTQAAGAYSPPPGPIAPPQPAPETTPPVAVVTPAQALQPSAARQPPSADDLLTELLANF